MQYRVLRQLELSDGRHEAGELVDGDSVRNLDALVSQRWLKPIGDRDRIEALEVRVADLEATVTGKGKSKH